MNFKQPDQPQNNKTSLNKLAMMFGNQDIDDLDIENGLISKQEDTFLNPLHANAQYPELTRQKSKTLSPKRKLYGLKH